MSSLEINSEILSLFKLGLKHVFSPQPLKAAEVLSATEAFKRRLNLSHFFRNEANENIHFERKLHIPKPGFNPRPPTELAAFQSLIENHILFHFRRRGLRNKLDPTLVTAKSLIQNNNLVIKPADKNLGLVLMDKNDYLKALTKVTRNPNDYTLIGDVSDPNTIQIVTVLTHDALVELRRILKFHDHIFNRRNPQYRKWLLQTFIDNHTLPHLYGLPKIHKLDDPINLGPGMILPLRPIVSCKKWITTRASILIEVVLQKTLNHFNDYILRDSSALIRATHNLNVPADSLLVSFDIVNFYGNMTVNEIFDALKKVNDEILGINIWYRQQIPPRDTIPPIDDYILDLIHFVLQNNLFSAGPNVYHQKSGMAMGTNMAVVLANLFGLGLFELPLSRSLDIGTLQNGQIFWRRYIDDTFTIIPPSPDRSAKQKANDLFEWLNTQSETHQMDESRVNLSSPLP